MYFVLFIRFLDKDIFYELVRLSSGGGGVRWQSSFVPFDAYVTDMPVLG